VGVSARRSARLEKSPMGRLDADGLADLLGDPRPAVRKTCNARTCKTKGPAGGSRSFRSCWTHSTLRSRLSPSGRSNANRFGRNAGETGSLALAEIRFCWCARRRRNSASVWRDRGAVPDVIRAARQSSAQKPPRVGRPEGGWAHRRMPAPGGSAFAHATCPPLTIRFLDSFVHLQR